MVGFRRLDAAGAGGDLGDCVVVDMGSSFRLWCRSGGEDELGKGWGEVMMGNRVDAEARVACHNPLEVGFYREISESSGNNLQDINRLSFWRVFGLRLSHHIGIHTYKTDRTEVLQLEEQVYSLFVQIKLLHLPLESQGEADTRLIVDLDQKIKIMYHVIGFIGIGLETKFEHFGGNSFVVTRMILHHR